MGFISEIVFLAGFLLITYNAYANGFLDCLFGIPSNHCQINAATQNSVIGIYLLLVSLVAMGVSLFFMYRGRNTTRSGTTG